MRPSLPAIPHSSSATRLAGSIFDARKFGRVWRYLAWLAPAVTSRRQKALRHFSQLGALNLCAVGSWRRREGLESDAARWSLESREVFGAMLAQRRLVERDARA